MKKVRELIRSAAERDEAEIIREVRKLLMKEDGMYAITARVTNNFYLGAEQGAASAYIFTEYEDADTFARNIRDRGLLVKPLEIRPAQRTAFFQDLIRSGFEAVCIDYGPDALVLTLGMLFEKPGPEAGVMNPELVRAANGFYQNLALKKAVPEQQSEFSRELYEAEYLIPVSGADGKEPPLMQRNEGGSFCPVFTDMVEFARYDRKGQYEAKAVDLEDLRKIARGTEGIVVNPFGFGLSLDRMKMTKIITDFGERGM